MCEKVRPEVLLCCRDGTSVPIVQPNEFRNPGVGIAEEPMRDLKEGMFSYHSVFVTVSTAMRRHHHHSNSYKGKHKLGLLTVPEV